MITWVTVWVLTVFNCVGCSSATYTYQLTYASQKTCKEQLIKHTKKYSSEARCDFQQIPVVTK